MLMCIRLGAIGLYVNEDGITAWFADAQVGLTWPQYNLASGIGAACFWLTWEFLS